MDVPFGHKGWLILRLLFPLSLPFLLSTNWFSQESRGLSGFPHHHPNNPTGMDLVLVLLIFLLGDGGLVSVRCNHLSIKHMVSTECKKFCLLMRRLLREIRSGPVLRSLPFVAECRQRRGQVDLCREGRIARDTVAILSFPLIFQEACVSALGFRGIPWETKDSSSHGWKKGPPCHQPWRCTEQRRGPKMSCRAS